MIRVLVVEDEPLTASAHADYVRRVDGFEVAAVAGSGAEAIRALRADAGIDLILLDMNLPDMGGLDLCRSVRAAGLDVDVIAITAVRDAAVVRASVAAGIVQYLIKPFTYSAFGEKLGAYQDFRQSLVEQASATTQAEVDQAFASLRPATAAALPKGLSAETLRAVSGLLKELHAPTSAIEVSEALSMSRVTARRYLEHLADQQSVLRTSRYGTRGRPEFEYSWARSPTDR